MIEKLWIWLSSQVTLGDLGSAASITGVVASLIGIGISAIIARRQHLHRINTDQVIKNTKTIIEDLNNRTTKSRNKEILFPTGAHGLNRLHCMFPGNMTDRPMYQIVAGDYELLNSVSIASGRQIEKHAVSKCDVVTIDPQDDYIFICTPAVNSGLRQILPAVIKKANSWDIEQPPESVESAQLPCWFCERPTEAPHAQKCIVRLKDYWESRKLTNEDFVESKSDEAYRIAIENFSSQDGKPYAKTPDFIKDKSTHTDYGIFMRMYDNVNGRWYYAAAGIHTYGTWILADYIADFAIMDNLRACPGTY